MRRSLGKERRKEIADSLLRDGDFSCHKTNKFDDDGKTIVDENSTRCIGAAMWLDKSTPGGKFSNLCFRLAAMTKEFPINLKYSQGICQSYNEFVNDSE